MYDKLTSDQKNAVNAQGAVIVTAAAGSGKTAVLAERVIDKIANKNLSADRLLIVTFTNLAAVEMQNRIQKRLFVECEKAPENMHLLKQRLLISSADICTIDSFCIRLLRNNFSSLGLNPDFKIADTTTEDLITKKVIGDILKEHYEKGEPEFFEFLRSTDSIYSDANAVALVTSLYDKVMTLPFYKEMLDKMLCDYNPENIFESRWYKYIILKVISRFSELIGILDSKVEILKGDDIAYAELWPCFVSFKTYFLNIINAANEGNFEALRSTLINPPEKPSFRKKFDEVIKGQIKAVFEIIAAALKDFIPIFTPTSEELKREISLCEKFATVVVNLCKEFDERYFEELTKRGYITFAISEQLAFNLLCENKNGDFAPTEFSKEIVNLYDEVMVDEYQDVNFLQNALFYILSDMGKKLFSVGDAKQSIYGFRNANPEFFIRKSESAENFREDLEDDILKRVVLSANFRSRKGVCSFVNGFFSLAMSEKFGGMKYDENERLNASAEFLPNGEEEVEIHLLDSADDGPERVANYIQSAISKPLMVQGKDEQGNPALRPVNYGDFAVLFRASTKFSQYYNTFLKYGIPVSISDGNFFETTEIKCIISFLTAINSPMNDTAMLSVLLSPVFGFTVDDIAKLKLNNKKERLYKLINLYGGEKFKEFLDVFNLYRKKAALLTVADLISFILEHSNLKNYFSAHLEGERRFNNLLYFEELGANFTSDNGGDLSDFLRHIKYLSEKGEIKSSATAGDDSVKFLTMHKSKGLQFPVVLVAELASAFSSKSVNEDLAVDENLGLAFNRLDDDEAIKYVSTPKKIINMHISQKAKEEELRLLYVVMTRAKEKLVIFLPFGGKSSPFTVAADKIRCFAENGGISTSAFLECKNAGAWVAMYALMLPSFKFLREELGITDDLIPLSVREEKVNAKCVLPDNEVGVISAVETEENSKNDLKLSLEKLREIFEYKYPYEELRTIQAKTSVSALLKERADADYFTASRPAFMSDKGLSPTERGTALHKFMQYADFKKLEASATAEIERLYEFEFLSRAEADSIDPNKITDFAGTDIFKRIVSSRKILREQRFLLNLKSGELYNGLDDAVKDEEVIIQGAIDCMFFEEDGIVLIDFKTDRTNDEKVLIENYKEQLRIYSIAAEKMFGQRVKERYIYSVNMGKWIKIP